MATKLALEPIPQPPGNPLIGNVLTVDANRQIQSLMDLAEQYGPIYQLDIDLVRSMFSVVQVRA